MNERNTFAIRFECKSQKIQKDGRAPVLGIITINGKEARVQLPLKCKPADFRALLKSRSSNQVKRITDKFRVDVEEIRTTLHINEEPETAARIKDIYLNGYTKTSYTLQDLFDGFKQQKTSEDIQPHTWNKYENAFNGFLKDTGHSYTDEVSSIKPKDILLYEAKLRKRSADTTACKCMKNVKAFFSFAIAAGKSISNPFGTMRIGHGTPAKDTEYLTFDEISALKKVIITSDRLENVRTLFLWQCFTGQNYADLTILKKGDVQKDDKGRYHINKARYKRGKYGKEHFYDAYLYEDAIDIYEKYGEEGVYGLLISPSKYNAYLGEIIKEAKIDKNITTKSGRKTYACYLYNTAKIRDLTIIQAMMGHESLRQTQEYIKVFQNTIAEAVQKSSENEEPPLKHIMDYDVQQLIQNSKRIN